MGTKKQDSRNEKEIRNFILKNRDLVKSGDNSGYENICLVVDSIIDSIELNPIPRYEFYEYYICSQDEKLSVFDKFSKFITENMNEYIC